MTVKGLGHEPERLDVGTIRSEGPANWVANFRFGLDPAISTRSDFAKDAIPLSKHPMEMAGSSQVKPGHMWPGAATRP
jgi:hypothetical protein